MKILETSRLLLRPFTVADAPFILELLNSAPWLQFIGDRGVRTLADAEDYLRARMLKSYEENGFGLCATVLRESGKTIGSCGLVRRASLPDVDLGFAFLPGFEGRGFGYEASLAVLDFAEKTVGLRRLVAITLPTNVASIGLLEKLGFVFEKNIAFEDGEELGMYGMNFLVVSRESGVVSRES